MEGFWSIVPPLVAVVLAMVTKRVLISLFVSIWVGGLIVTDGNPLSALAVTFDWIKDVMIDPWNARFLVLIALLGSGAALMFKIGGSHSLASSLEKKLTNRKRSQLLAYFLGIIVFFNDYVNSVIAGNGSKDVTAKHKVSREKLAYILDGTSAPMATLGPVSDWIGFQVSLIAAAFATIHFTGVQAYGAFLHSIPWNFYAILTLLAIPITIMGKDFGPMARAEWRAMKKGEIIAEGATPLSSVENDLGEPFRKGRYSIWNFIIPLATLIGVGLFGIWYTGGGPSGKSITDALADTDVSVALTWAAFAMTFVGVVIALFQKVSLSEIEESILAGFRTMLPALVIMILAWSIGTVCDVLGTADYVVGATKDWMTPTLLPFLLFIVGMFISFATGTSWGTMAILTPVAIPLAFTVGDIDLIYIAIGAVFAGSIFGDHISPISDTTVMASIFAGCDHIAHVTTQIPYALVTAGVSSILYLASSFVKNGYILLGAGIIIQFVVFKLLGEIYHKKLMQEEKEGSAKDVAL